MKNLDFNVVGHLIFDALILLFFGFVEWRSPNTTNTIFSFVAVLVAFWSPSPIQLTSLVSQGAQVLPSLLSSSSAPSQGGDQSQSTQPLKAVTPATVQSK